MTPTLSGRIQTRIVTIAVIGSIWTLIIGPFLPRPEGASLTDMYKAMFTALVVVGGLGVVWEIVYHALQQYRWEKDWPTLFGLLQAIPEGIVAYLVLNAGLPWDVRPILDDGSRGSFPLPAFLIMFISLWLLIWAFVNGPMQILSPRWRYRGGRFDPNW